LEFALSSLAVAPNE
jgi:hypothetical protein